MRQRVMWLVVVLMGLGTAESARAYTLLGAKWPAYRIPVPWHLNPSTAPAGFTDACTGAASTWSTHSQIAFQFAYQGTTAIASANGSDGVHAVYWQANGAGMSASTLAVTWYWSSGGTATHFDMIFNGTHTWSTSGSGGVDVQTVALHEFGHALGLGHSSLGSAVMYYAYHGYLRTLTQDDVDGAASMYPAPNLPGAVQLVDPPQTYPNKALLPASPSLKWTASENADYYQVLFHIEGQGFYRQVDGVMGTTYTPSPALPGKNTYFWWVRGMNSAGAGPWSNTGYFGVDLPGAPKLLAPTGTISPGTVTFQWTPTDSTTHYELWVDHYGIQSKIVYQPSVSGTSYTTPTALPADQGSFAWIVRSFNGSTPGPWSSTGWFTISATQPGEPTCSAPYGTVTTTTPAFTWTAAANATHYELLVNSDAGGTALQVGSLTGTTYTPTSGLGTGGYRWYVRAWNGGKAGAWSSSMDFNIPSPGSVTLLGPSGSTTSSTPTFSWTADPYASSYELWVDLYGQTSRIVYASGLTGTTYTPSSALPLGKYAWVVRSWMGTTPGSWSSTGWFTIAPGAPTLIAPQGGLASSTITFSWNAAALATSYEIQVNQVGVRPYVIMASGIPGTSYSVTASLEPGKHEWWVRGSSGGVPGPWSSSLIFDVPGAGGSAQISPVGTIASTTPTFSWTAVGGASSYELWVYRGSSEIYRSEGIAGTSATLPAPLVEGVLHYWWIRAWFGGSPGPWSNTASFTVSGGGGGGAIGTPSPTAPTGAISDPTQTFTWGAAANATTYELQVNLVDIQPYVVTASGVSGTSYVSSTVLQPGLYRWWVRGWNGGQSGPWSGGTDFTVQALGAPTLLSPRGNIYSTGPAFTWSAVGGATSYELWVLLDSPRQDTFRGAGIAGTSYTLAAPLSVGSKYYWYVRAVRGATPGPWSGTGSFTVAIDVPSCVAPRGVISQAASYGFSWTAATNATSYELQVDEVGGAAGVIVVSGIGATSYTSTAALRAGVTHRWKVRGRNGAGGGPWSTPLDFSLVSAGVPGTTALTGPAGTVGIDGVIFTWTAATAATHYELWVNVAGGPQYYYVANVSGTSHTPTKSFDYGAYRAWIRPWNGSTAGVWSPGFDFTVAGVLARPTLLSPEGWVWPTPATFKWTKVEGAATYELSVARKDTGEVILSRTGIPQADSPSTEVGAPLVHDVSYLWKVRGVTSDARNGDFSLTKEIIYSEDGREDWEEGLVHGWTPTGFWHIVTLSATSTPAVHSAPQSDGTSKVMWYGRDATGNYNNGATNSGYLTSPLFTVPLTRYHTLSFLSWEETENYAGYDKRTLELSTNGGTSWTQIWLSSDNSRAWRTVSLSLSSYAGRQIKLRFRFNTVDGAYNNYRGWYLDNIALVEVLPSSTGGTYAPTVSTDQTRPEFAWPAVEEATHYDLRVLDAATGDPAIETAVEGQTTFRSDSPLLPGKTYHWWVRGYRLRDSKRIESPWSERQEFKVGGEGLPAPAAWSPKAATEAGAGGAVTFKWSPVSGAGYYEVRVHEKEGALSVVSANNLKDTSHSATGLKSGVRYVWWVRAWSADGKVASPWSEGTEFNCSNQ